MHKEGPHFILRTPANLVEKMAHRLGTFFGLPNHFHLTQCDMVSILEFFEIKKKHKFFYELLRHLLIQTEF